MTLMLKKRDSKMDDFQVASCTLDASTKIYACRVDCVHRDVLKMAADLATGHRKKQAVSVGTEEGEGEEERSGTEGNDELIYTKKKTRKPKKTIVTNVETLNAKIDVQHVLDPSLRSAGNIGDCHFLSSLKVRANCALTLCSDLPYWDNNEEPISSEQFKVRLPFIPDLKDKGICPVFSQFSFTKWSLDAEEDENDPVAKGAAGLLESSEDDDFAFDVNAVPEPIPTEETEALVDHFEVSGVDEGMDSEGEDTGAPVACWPVQRAPAANVVDLRKHLSAAPSEYSYFRAGALDLWAGPSHWKIKPFKGVDQHRNSAASANTAGDEPRSASACKKQKQKKEFVVEFLREHNSDAFILETNPQKLMLTKRTMQKLWSADKNTLPPDVHFDVKCFSQLELRKVVCVSEHPAPYEGDEPSSYDYENDLDTSEYCPNVALNDMDAADDGPVDILLASQHQDVHNSLTADGCRDLDTFAGDNLVAPPSKVARIFIPYAMRAKKVDMKKLKHAIWSILTKADSHKDKDDNDILQVERPVTFKSMYTALPSRLSSKLLENICAPLVLVALLHLANEKTLHIVGNEDLSDLVITQG
ncbi:condensin complex subunit 2 isoform X3 [Zootermopsis nevadensis]|nr:condensin complex subunit 2 isoform X3 [Zootermopsis nevadensis]